MGIDVKSDIVYIAFDFTNHVLIFFLLLFSTLLHLLVFHPFPPCCSVSEDEYIGEPEAVQDSYSAGNGGNVCPSIEHSHFGICISADRALVVNNDGETLVHL